MAHISNITEGIFKDNTEIILSDDELFTLRTLLIDLKNNNKLPKELKDLTFCVEEF